MILLVALEKARSLIHDPGQLGLFAHGGPLSPAQTHPEIRQRAGHVTAGGTVVAPHAATYHLAPKEPPMRVRAPDPPAPAGDITPKWTPEMRAVVNGATFRPMPRHNAEDVVMYDDLIANLSGMPLGGGQVVQAGGIYRRRGQEPNTAGPGRPETWTAILASGSTGKTATWVSAKLGEGPTPPWASAPAAPAIPLAGPVVRLAGQSEGTHHATVQHAGKQWQFGFQAAGTIGRQAATLFDVHDLQTGRPVGDTLERERRKARTIASAAVDAAEDAKSAAKARTAKGSAPGAKTTISVPTELLGEWEATEVDTWDPAWNDEPARAAFVQDMRGRVPVSTNGVSELKLSPAAELYMRSSSGPLYGITEDNADELTAPAAKALKTLQKRYPKLPYQEYEKLVAALPR